VPAAERVGKAAAKVGTAMDAAAGATGRARDANGRFVSGAAAAAAGADTEAAAMNAASGAIERKVGWIGRLVASLRGVPAAASGAAAGVTRVTAAANDNAGAMRANVGNIAAQFQDIGVTAAMGMNPMMIALQQGTQLSAVFAASGQSLGKTLSTAFASVISPVALLTIGFVALAAAGLQAVDWSGLAVSSLRGLADVLETIAPYAVGAGVALALIYSPAIISGIASVVAGLWSMAAGLLAIIPIPVLIVAGLTAIVAAANYFRDDLTKILGFDIVKAAKTGLNFIIGGFVGGFKTVQATWRMLPAALGDSVIGAVNWVLRGIDKMVNASVDRINGLIKMLPDWLGGNSGGISYRANSGQVANPLAGSAAAVGKIAADTIGKEQGKDWVGGFVEGVGEWAEWGAGKLRGLADSIAAGDKKKGKKDKEPKDKKSSLDNLAFRDHAEEILRKYDKPIAVDEIVLPDRPQVDAYFDNLSDAIGRAQETARGFFSDMKSGLEQGKSIWSSFGSSVLGALSKIQNRLMDKLLNSAIDSLFSSMGDSGTGGFIKKLFSAKGNAFDSGGVQRFAKGGDFTNSIVTSPTLFQYAKGGAIGEMGEAGPEAILPLQRGPDGSLGVQSMGGGGGMVVNAPITISNDNRVTGAVSSADIVEMQKRSAQQTKDQLSQELPSIIQQYNQNGGWVPNGY